MAQVTVLVNGRNYTLACEDGEEEHLTALAGFIDKRVAELGIAVGQQVGDTRLMLMASLVVADELAVANERVEELEHELEALRSEKQAAVEAIRFETQSAVAEAAVASEERFAAVLESAAQRIEDIAARLQ